MKDSLPQGAVEVLAGRLYWAAVEPVPRDTETTHFFSIDAELVYEPFCADFGPLNLAMVYRYCKQLEAKLSDPMLTGRHIVHCCSQDEKKRANAALLICAYQVIVLQRSAKAVYLLFEGLQPQLIGFRDALPRPCSFRLTVLDCLEGLEKSIELGWFSFSKFDVEDYDWLDNVENCDASWVVPDKFLAFAGPAAASKDAEGFPTVTPEDCLPIFRKAGIGLVIRLNKKDYDRRRFVDQGVKHVDLYFADGSCPPQEIVSKFLHITECEPGPVAVHCKAGLGRTCTLIGLYAMKHFRFPARAFIGWARICRPGSVLGPQQQFLVDMQDEMFRAISVPRGLGSPAGPRSNVASGDRVQKHCPSPQAAPAAVRRDPSAALGSRARVEPQVDVGQGERLCGAKRGGRLSTITAAEPVAAPYPRAVAPAPAPALTMVGQMHPAAVPPQPPPQSAQARLQAKASPKVPPPQQLQPVPAKAPPEQPPGSPLRAVARQPPARGPTPQPPQLQPAPQVKVPAKVMLTHSVAGLPLEAAALPPIGRRPVVVRQASVANLCHTVRPRHQEQSPRPVVSAF